MHEIDVCTVRSKWQHENDPTWLSEVEVLVANIIQKLLLLTNITIPAHISVDQIRCFKTLYSSVGLHCRYSSCKNHCVTYRSESERRKHELDHVRSYRCMECDFAERPFTSRQDLRKHQEKYHMTPVNFAIPLQIRSLAAKSLPPLRHKTQKLGVRKSYVGLSTIDQSSPNDLRAKISNARIDLHQNTQTTSEYADQDTQRTREYSAMPKGLDLTDTSERDYTETFGSADLASTSCIESVVAHKPESVCKLKAVPSPKMCSISEASFPIGEPIQTATETSYENPLMIDHIGESHHEPNTCNKNPSEDMDVVHVENSTESILRLGDGDSEGASDESCVARCIRIAAEVHIGNRMAWHSECFTGQHQTVDEAVDEAARRIRPCTPPGAQLGPDTCNSCWQNCWSHFIDSYIVATFANENAIPGISKEDIERRLMVLICYISTMGRNTFHGFLKPPTRFLPQEMIRFEQYMKLDGENAIDLPTFLEKFRRLGPKHLKEYHQRSMPKVNAYLDVDEDDIAHLLFNDIDYIRDFPDDRIYVHLLFERKYFQDRIRHERIRAHSMLWKYILSLVHPVHGPVHGPLGIDAEGFTHYVLSLLCKQRNPTEMVKSLKNYLKPSK